MPSAHPTLLLASASPARRSALLAAGVEPLVRVSSVDEDDVVATAEAGQGRLAAADIALLLARAKAEDVVTARDQHRAPRGGGLFVRGSAPSLGRGGGGQGNPADAKEAVERWRRMRGR